MAIKIYADAGSNLFKSFLDENGYEIKIISMDLNVEGKIYHCYDDHINIDKFAKEFYQEMLDGKEVQTSLANPFDFRQAFKDDIKAGNQIVCFTMAKGISGTYNSACIAAEEFNEKAGEEVIHVVDTMTAGLGEGSQAINAFKLTQKGLSFKEIVNEVEKFKYKVRSEFTVDNIKYLSKTGRVNSIVAKLVSLLNIKIMLKGSNNSTIEMTGKVRGRIASIHKLAEQCLEHIVDKTQLVYITHSMCYEDALTLKNLLAKGGVNNVYIGIYDFITGSHVGPGTIAIFYVGKNRD